MGFYNESSPPPQRRPGLLGPAPPGVMSMQQQQQPNAGVRSVSEHNDVDLRQMQGPPSKFYVHITYLVVFCSRVGYSSICCRGIDCTGIKHAMLSLKYILLFGFSFTHYCVN